MSIKAYSRQAAAAIASVRNAADELIVVVDPNPGADLRELLAPVADQILERPWAGFGRAFNHALDAAHGNWVFRIDADEVLDPASRQPLAWLCSSDERAVYSVARYNYGPGPSATCSFHERLFRAHPSLRYRLPTWEQLDWRVRMDLGYVNRTAPTVLHHLGHSRLDHRQKHEHLLSHYTRLGLAARALPRSISAWTEALAMWQVAQRRVALHDYARALESASPLVHGDQTYWRLPAALLIGDVLRALGRSFDAEVAFTTALTLARTAMEVVAVAENGLALALYDQGKTTGAEEHFRRALQLNPSLWHVHLNLGLIAQRRGEHANAVHFFRRVVELNQKLTNLEDELPPMPSSGPTISHVLPGYKGIAHHRSISETTLIEG